MCTVMLFILWDIYGGVFITCLNISNISIQAIPFQDGTVLIISHGAASNQGDLSMHVRAWKCKRIFLGEIYFLSNRKPKYHCIMIIC